MSDDWITYEELGVRLGVSTQAARAHVRRHGWPRHTPNAHGARALVQVPEGTVVQPRAASDGVRMADAHPAGHPNGHDRVQVDDQPHEQPAALLAGYEGAIRALEAAIETLREQLQHERDRADRAERRADAERTRAELRIAELMRPWWRRYFRW